MEYHFVASDEVNEIRGRLDHPILDADGHQVEFVPFVDEIVREIGGKDILERFQRTRTEHQQNGTLPLAQHWGHAAHNMLDRVTTTIPKLLYSRLDEFGIDFGLLYPSVPGLYVSTWTDEEVRRVGSSALNKYIFELFGKYRDRLEPVATIPMVTPEEAIYELNHAVGELGLKAIVMSGTIPRTVRPDGTKFNWIDTLGHNSLYDYDPVWKRCEELGVAPAFHGAGNGFGTRVSNKNFVYNHIGHFGVGQEGICRSLVMGGVPRRFPNLQFSFLEGGISWAAQLFGDLLGHYDKRNKDVVSMFNPAEQDPVVREELFRAFAEGRLAKMVDVVAEGFGQKKMAHRGEITFDEFAEGRINGPGDIVDEFARQFYFGCEADDPMNSIAFNRKLLPHHIRLNAMFASDIGHFDVPDMREVLPEAWEGVEDGLMDQDDFRDFSCDNLIRLMTPVNPKFFDGTVVEDYARSVIEKRPAASAK